MIQLKSITQMQIAKLTFNYLSKLQPHMKSWETLNYERLMMLLDKSQKNLTLKKQVTNTTVKVVNLLNQVKNHSVTPLKTLIDRKVTRSGKENRHFIIFTKIRGQGQGNNHLGISNTHGTVSTLEMTIVNKQTSSIIKTIQISTSLLKDLKSLKHLSL